MNNIMKEFAVDWAVKKEYYFLEISTNKLTKKILQDEDQIEKFLTNIGPSIFRIEEGGADIFKFMANTLGNKILLISGEVIKNHREKLGIDKSDENDVNIIANLPSTMFREYTELDKNTSILTLTTREYSKLCNELVRSKLRKLSLERRLVLTQDNKKLLQRREEDIKALERTKNAYSKEMIRYLEKHPFYTYLKNLKGAGPLICASLISEIKTIERFSTSYKLRTYAGMVGKKDCTKYNRHLKNALYHFSMSAQKKITEEKWTNTINEAKAYYAAKYPEWSKGKVQNYGLKRMQSLFLDHIYEEWSKI